MWQWRYRTSYSQSRHKIQFSCQPPTRPLCPRGKGIMSPSNGTLRGPHCGLDAWRREKNLSSPGNLTTIPWLSSSYHSYMTRLNLQITRSPYTHIFFNSKKKPPYLYAHTQRNHIYRLFNFTLTDLYVYNTQSCTTWFVRCLGYYLRPISQAIIRLTLV